jgi:hypothetical protein
VLDDGGGDVGGRLTRLRERVYWTHAPDAAEAMSESTQASFSMTGGLSTNGLRIRRA